VRAIIGAKPAGEREAALTFSRSALAPISKDARATLMAMRRASSFAYLSAL
jgi:hypothetical protein